MCASSWLHLGAGRKTIETQTKNVGMSCSETCSERPNRSITLRMGGRVDHILDAGQPASQRFIYSGSRAAARYLLHACSLHAYGWLLNSMQLVVQAASCRARPLLGSKPNSYMHCVVLSSQLQAAALYASCGAGRQVADKPDKINRAY